MAIKGKRLILLVILVVLTALLIASQFYAVSGSLGSELSVYNKKTHNGFAIWRDPEQGFVLWQIGGTVHGGFVDVRQIYPPEQTEQN